MHTHVLLYLYPHTHPAHTPAVVIVMMNLLIAIVSRVFDRCEVREETREEKTRP